MSSNWENVIWQSENERWNIGFYAQEQLSQDTGQCDNEWDVEYDYNEFAHVLIGYCTPEAARDAWTGPNPGSSSIVPYSKESAQMFDQMAQFCLNPEMKAAAQKKEEKELAITHRKTLQQKFVKNQNFQSDYVTVLVKEDSQPWTQLGAIASYTGYMWRAGDWLTVEGQPVINTVTGQLNPNLHNISVQRYNW